MIRHTRACAAGVLLLVLLLVPAPRHTQLHAQAPALAGLSTIYDITRGAARDTNGDGLADTVVARVIVPAQPSSEDIEAATNIAARLGYETTALTLPFVLRADAVEKPASIALPILVGRENPFVRKLADAGAIDLKSLGPGQGLISLVPSPLGGPDGVVVVGGDDEGTLAAAVELAARLPRLWGMTAASLSTVEQQTLQYLKSKGLAVSGASLTSVVVERDRRGLAGVTVRVPVAAGQAPAVAKAFEGLDAAHNRGQEPRTLNFANTAAIVIEAVAGGKTAGRAVVHRAGYNQRTLTPPIDPDELAPDSPGDRGRAAEGEAAAGPSKTFDLTSAYTIKGYYGDAYADLIPDRSETTVIVSDPKDSFGASHIAARLGLETTGITLPITKRDRKVRQPEREQNPILVGRDNELAQQLAKIGKVRLDDLQPGEGMVQVVPRAFGASTATVVAGADPRGTEAASLYLARRVPFVWDTARGALSLQEVATEVNRFLQARTGAGQASQIAGEVDKVVGELEDKLKDGKIESLDAKLFVETADPGLEKFVANRLNSAIRLKPDPTLKGSDPTVKVTSQGLNDPVTVFEDKLDIPWEVDDFWKTFRADVLPKVKTGSKVELETRLSESPEVRQKLAKDITAQLAKAGAASPRVRVMSAYKQGFGWLVEQVIPDLKGKGAKSVLVKVARYEPDFSKKYKFYQVPSRWLHELYPADEIFERELAVPKSAFALELVPNQKDVYVLEASDASGRVVYRASFSPKFAEREYLDKFPGWSRVQVTTGWITASVDGQAVADSRIQTDPERFWDYYQAKVLPRVYDYVMKVTENRPLPDKQPFHRDLDVEVWMSEPDYKIGVDEELVSSLEALHEDIYFVTLDFFDALGRTVTKRRLGAPGKIFPIIHPNRPGQPGQARVLYAGNASAKPKIEISYREKGVEKPVRISRELTKIDVTPALVNRVVARADRVSEIELQVEAKDDREAGRAVDAFNALATLQAAGLYKAAVSYEHVDRVAISVGLKDVRSRPVVRNTGSWLPSNVRTAQAKPAHPLVKWDHIISPDEAEEIAGKLAAYPEVTAYKAGKSYRGREISVMEITLPSAGELVSIPKLTAYKPTIFMTGRQHANEVSSTSHMLRLAELFVTDPAYKAMLKKLNVILQPVENPDGAQMAFDLQKLTPTYILHAGRYSALGMDVGSQVGQPDPLLPEALVRNRLWQQWLPDIYLNPHGYPSHEWVQQFAGYVPPGFRSYWSTRGWYTSASGLRDPRYPNHALVADTIRENIVREINSNPEVRAMDLRSQARYRKWAYGFAPQLYNQEIYKDTAIYATDPESGQPSGSRRAGASRGGGEGGRDTMAAWPQVTYFSGGTEAPDETAQGPWMDLVSKAGFSYLMASVKYLRDGKYQIDRIEEDGQRDSATRTMLRARPVLPGRAPAPAVPTTTSTTVTTTGGTS